PNSFDVSVWELVWPLVAGARLVLAPPGAQRDPAALQALIETHRVTTLHFVPSMLRAFLAEADPRRLGGVRRVIASGEELPRALADRCLELLPHAELWNLYGPTET